MIPAGVARSGPPRDFRPQVATEHDVLLMSLGYGSVASAARESRRRAGEDVPSDEWWHWESRRPPWWGTDRHPRSLTRLTGERIEPMTEDYSDLPTSYTLPAPDRNPGEVERMTYDELHALLADRFGPDPAAWAFICPACATTQTAADAEPYGAVAKAHIGRMCVRAYLPADDPQRCTWNALGASGGPLTVTRRVTYGVHAQPSMQVAPAPAAS